MPANNPEYQKEYKQKHYAANKQKYIDQAAARKKLLKEEINALKSVPCMDCGIQYPPYVMDFDHRPGEEKVGAIAKMVNNVQRAKIFVEIEKCDVVCSNCHRERTNSRQSASVV